MSKVAVVTDSTSDMPIQTALRLGIQVIPLSVHFGDEVYRDGIDIFPEEFYSKLRSTHILPRTSQPSPGDFATTYSRLLDAGAKTILSIHISSKLSGTLGSAQVARDYFPEADIRLFDSQMVSSALGLLVMDAGSMAAQGDDVNLICAHIERRITRLRLLFTLDTLEYLHRNGRIGKAANLIGTLLSLKPILTLTDGAITPFEKTRGRNMAIKRMLDVVREDLATRTKEKAIAVIHGCYPEAAQKLHDELMGMHAAEQVLISELGPVVGVHVGPGALGIAY